MHVSHEKPRSTTYVKGQVGSEDCTRCTSPIKKPAVLSLSKAMHRMVALMYRNVLDC